LISNENVNIDNSKPVDLHKVAIPNIIVAGIIAFDLTEVEMFVRSTFLYSISSPISVKKLKVGSEYREI
jgi:hypothetical protein